MSTRIEATLHDDQITVPETPYYWQAYGLHQDPFAMDLDPLMYYAPPHWEEYLDLLQYLCHYNNDLLVIAGVSGSGKTTLVNEFIAQVDDTMRTCYADANTQITSERLVEILTEGFDLTTTALTEEPVEEQLNACLDEIQNSDRICVLIIDNAHTLPTETLELLLYIIQQQSEDRMRLHILLLGEPRLQITLLRLAETEGYERDSIHNLALEPLTREETKQYLKHRLTIAGLTGDIPLSEETITRMHKLSEGIPGRINRIARRALLNEIPSSENESSPSWLYHNRYKLLGGVVLIALLAGISSLLNWANQEDGLVGKKDIAPTIAFQNEAAAPATTPITSSAPAPSNPVTASQTQAITPTAPEAAASNVTTPIAATPASTTTVTTAQPAAVQPAPGVEPSPTSSPATTATTAAEEPKPRNWQQNELQAIKNSAQKTKASKTKSVSEPPSPPIPVEAAETAAVTAEPIIPEKPVQSQPAVKKDPASTKSNSRPYTTDETRLLAVPRTRYTLQFTGFNNEQEIKALITEQQLGSKAAYFRSVRDGVSQFVLVYGSYPSAQQANAAVATLPPALQERAPWARAMSIVHETIRQAARS